MRISFLDHIKATVHNQNDSFDEIQPVKEASGAFNLVKKLNDSHFKSFYEINSGKVV
jgi:hypothetical protein